MKSAVIGDARRNLPVCVLDEDPDQVELSTRLLERAGFPPLGTTNPQEALQKVRMGGARAVLAAVKMRVMDGFTFLEKALQHDPDIYVILTTWSYSADSAIEAVKRGASDYLCKPLALPRLAETLDDLAFDFSQRSEIRTLEEKLFENSQFQGITGRSPVMVEMFELVKRAARHYTNVLITGPTGAGKELVARASHQLSPVARERFAVCNCSAVADALLESQLFGRIKGSLAGADTQSGLFEYANGGTLFLDEIGETSLAMQAKLLRVIQNREIQMAGSPELRTVNVRIIAATNRDLRAEVLVGRFRKDLYDRLAGIEIRVPALKERSEDIPVLVRHFLKQFGEAYGKRFQGLSRRAQIVLSQHEWPGNVRELENVISSAAIIANDDFIDVDDLPERLQKPLRRSSPSGVDGGLLPLDEVRRLHIQRVLETCKGNRVRAARLLGIGRTSLYRFLKRTNGQAASARSGV